MARSVGADKTRGTGTPLEVFGNAITALRLKRNESQATVAARVGCDEYYLRNIELGRENLSFELMYAIVGYMGMLPLSKFWLFAESEADRTRNLAR